MSESTIGDFVFTCPKMLKDKLAVKNEDNQEGVEDHENAGNEGNEEEYECQQFFPPKVDLPIVEQPTLEEDEDVIAEMRARIYRYIVFSDDEEDDPEFKERGTGVLKILQHKEKKTYRVLMRRDTTYKVCANHHIIAGMRLEPHRESDKIFVYSTPADLYEGDCEPCTFAVRFRNSEIASTFKEAFEKAVKEMENVENEPKESGADHLAEDFQKKVTIPE